MFDTEALLKITINGQLSLLMYCERLIEVGCKILMCNTDGVTFKYHKSLQSEVERVRKEWEDLTLMELETVNYKKILVSNINNYLALYEDSKTGEIRVKEKGFYLTNPPIDQSRNFLVIPKAVQAYFKDGIPIEEFITTHTDIYDFTGCQRVNRAYEVYHMGEKQQRLNRYYVSKKGAYLYKKKVGQGNLSHMLKGWGVILFNDYIEKDMKDYEIDYRYYISKCREIIEKLDSQQLKLF